MEKDTSDGSGLIVGVDLGDRWSRYCVLDQRGKVLEEDTVATTGRRLFGDRPAARVVIEVGTHSPWVQRLLRELGHETITADAAIVADTSTRTLLRAFQKRRGTSPMAFRRRRRFEAARRDLFLADPGETGVMKVAGRYCFDHLGRFATDYRALFGESPSETLRG